MKERAGPPRRVETEDYGTRGGTEYISILLPISCYPQLLPMDELGPHLNYWRCGAVGLPTWILVNGAWAALAGMADRAPEGFAISAYLIMCLSTGNLCPLLMNAYVLRDITPRGLVLVVAVLDAVGLVSGVAMALLWQETVSIGGQSSSLYLFIFFLAVGAASSAGSVAKFMLVANLSGAHTAHLSTGMALGSLVAGLLGLARGFTEDSGFSVTLYVLLLCVSYVPSVVCTGALWLRLRTADGAALLPDFEDSLLVPKQNSDVVGEDKAGGNMCCFSSHDMSYFNTGSPARGFLMVQAVVAALGFGLVPALLSTVCARFRSPYTVLLLSTGISTTIDPVGRYMTASRSFRTRREVFAAAAVLLGLASSLLVLGCLPVNVLYNSPLGGILPAVIYIFFIPLFGFLNTSVFLILKIAAPDGAAESDLVRLSGVMSQTGAMIGSIASFVVILLFL